MSDQQMINKARRGNQKAFQELIQQEKNKLYRMAYMYVKNENDALDIVQETIYKAYISIKKLKKNQYFSTWLTRILINNALDFIKKNKRVIPIEAMEEFRTTEIYEVEDHIDLVDAINQLHDQYKTVIILRYYQDFTVKQIAETLNCPEGTVKTHLHRAVKQLKMYLKEESIQ
ncbi:sigma-70 family RNA polymerase sigma factor [Gracilibacillus salinarum]|uniref:Sigma-70 family RNA polymerase sigma factor n=1 Tax=Gracilibacillus salinarum TaxID=2932255 RepID=A0ABY4GKN0_9BACI|nr:sigma-70 family RNA polymerase sigma factor [Gracilibacillus salinarum]UOQ84726.1 sigma-70 family RNA polymerase sigma factor [Gracilibacillus salinarum]